MPAQGRDRTRAEGLLSTVPGLRPAIALALGLFLVASGTLAGNAYWSAVGAKAASARAAMVSVTTAGGEALTVAYKQGFAAISPMAPPVLADTAPIDVTNTGGTPLNYTVEVSGGVAAVGLQLWKRGATCDAATTPAAGATSGTLAAPPALPSDAASAAAGASIALCARTTLTSIFSDAAGLSLVPTLTFTGRVGDNWNASAGTSFTQTASYNWFQVKHNSSAKCLDGEGAANTVGTRMVLFSCAAANATGNQSFRFEPVGSRYRIYIGNGTAAGPVIAPIADASNSQVQLVTKTIAAGAALDRQLWSIVQHGVAGDYQLINVRSGLCLTMLSSADLAPFTVDTCDNSTSTKKAAYQAEHFNFVEIP